MLGLATSNHNGSNVCLTDQVDVLSGATVAHLYTLATIGKEGGGGGGDSGGVEDELLPQSTVFK